MVQIRCNFVNWLYNNSVQKMDEASLGKQLTSGIERFPLFLKDKA